MERESKISSSQYLIECGLINRLSVGSKFHVAQVGPRVNHGQRRQNVIAEILNNFLGDPAELGRVQKPRMDNDDMDVQLSSMVS